MTALALPIAMKQGAAAGLPALTPAEWGYVTDTARMHYGTSGGNVRVLIDGDADAAGTAAGLMAAHLAAGDPHVQYLTEASAAATYAPLASPALTGTPTAPTAGAGTNTVQIASTAFVQAAVALAVTGLLDFKGALDCFSNPNYPAALKGDLYYVSVAGKIGGAAGKSVDVGDAVVASADGAGGNEVSVGPLWFVLEHNLAGALLAANNLSDVASGTTALTNLGGAAPTGTGGVVRATSPSLVTPALGTPVSGVLTNCTGTAAGLTAGAVVANGVTLAMLAQVAMAAFLGRTTAGTGNVEALTAAQATALLNAFAAAGGSPLKGLVPAPGATAHANRPYYLGDDGAWHKRTGECLGSNSFDHGGGSLETTGSTALVELATTQRLTFTLDEASDVWIEVACNGRNSIALNNVQIGVDVDGTTTIVNRTTCNSAGAAYSVAGSLKVTGLAAGSHTIQLRFAVNAGTGTFFARSVAAFRAES